MSKLLSRQAGTRLSPEVPADVQALWWRIEAYALDQAAVADPFSARLARDQRWSSEHTQRVIAEYKRFVLLAVTPSAGVAPSEAVDQVWHAHLTYTREYWDTFCRSVLGKPLHHAPGSGDVADQYKHLQNYSQTLERYRELFGESPPSDIWPSPEIRFGAQQASVRVKKRENLIVSWRSLRRVASVGLGFGLGIPLLFGAMASTEGMLLVGLSPIGHALALLGAEQLRRRPLPERAASGITLHAYEAIFLAAGEHAVADAVIANLVARNGLSWSGGSLTQRALFCDAHPLESAAYSKVASSQPGSLGLAELQAFIASTTRDLSTRLRGVGLTQSGSPSAAFFVASLAPVLLLVTALALHTAVLLAFIASLLVLAIAAARYFNEPGTSPLGKAALESFRQSHAPLAEARQPARVVESGELPAVVALAGQPALHRFGLSGLAEALRLARIPAADSCGSGGCGCGC